MMTTFPLPPLLGSPESELPFRRSTDEGLVEVDQLLEVEAEAAVAAAVITTTADLLDIVDAVAAPVTPLHRHRGREIEIDEIQAEVFRQVHVVVDAIDLEVEAEEEEEVALQSVLVDEAQKVVAAHAPARNSGPDGLALTVEIGGDDAREVERLIERRGTTGVEVEVAVVLVEIGIEMRVAAAADVGQAQVPIEGKTGLAKVRAVEGRRQGGTPKLRTLLLLC